MENSKKSIDGEKDIIYIYNKIYKDMYKIFFNYI